MFEFILIAFGFIFGGLPTLYVIYEAVATISMKIYRKLKFGISMFD